MTLSELTQNYRERYDNEANRSDTGTRNLFGLLAAAAGFSPSAQSEFVKHFSYEFALDGKFYCVGSRSPLCPTMLAEYSSLGFTAETVRNGVELTVANAEINE
jgi:hypothetical protein